MEKAIGNLLIAIPLIPVVCLAMVVRYIIAAWEIGWDSAETCARCRTEEDHDFDTEPDARFDRRGERIE